MDDTFNYTILLHLLIAPPILLFAIILKIFPPRNIDGWYGYPSPRARKSRAEWEAANDYSANTIAMAAMATLGVQLAAGLIFEALAGILVAVIFQALALIAVIPLTEHYLKKNFDENGKKIFLHQ